MSSGEQGDGAGESHRQRGFIQVSLQISSVHLKCTCILTISFCSLCYNNCSTECISVYLYCSTVCICTNRKPGVTGRGLYELRPEWNRYFNLYFHHYSRADQSKVHSLIWMRIRALLIGVHVVAMVTLRPVFQAEEAQRKLRRQSGEDTGKHTCTTHQQED